jgi:hypothetical protein
MLTLATIGMQLLNGNTTTNYMIVDIDRCGCWTVPDGEHSEDGQPFVYCLLSDAEQALETLQNKSI